MSSTYMCAKFQVQKHHRWFIIDLNTHIERESVAWAKCGRVEHALPPIINFQAFKKLHDSNNRSIHHEKITHKIGIVDRASCMESLARLKALMDDKLLFLLPHDAPFELN